MKETYQGGIDIYKPIRAICHLQDDDKQDIMAIVETYKQLYLLYWEPYQLNADYLEAFKANLKLSQAQNESVGYNPGLEVVALQEK